MDSKEQKKEEYEAPQVVECGTIKECTKAGSSGGGDGGSGWS